MPLLKELVIQSFVLLSKKPENFNPANFNQYWLDVNKIIPGDTIDKSSVFTPHVVQVSSDKMNLLITPDQIQVGPKSANLFREIVTNEVFSLVSNMDEVKLNGLGLNFNWFLSHDSVGIEELSYKYFYNQNDPGSSFFKTKDSLLGSYISKQINEDVRLKLDIKPVHLFDAVSGTSVPRIQFAFNFHSDLLVDNQKDKALEIMKNFDFWLDISSQVINLYN